MCEREIEIESGTSLSEEACREREREYRQSWRQELSSPRDSTMVSAAARRARDKASLKSHDIHS